MVRGGGQVRPHEGEPRRVIDARLEMALNQGVKPAIWLTGTTRNTSRNGLPKRSWRKPSGLIASA
jgi:hypothetical protein